VYVVGGLEWRWWDSGVGSVASSFLFEVFVVGIQSDL